MSKKYLEEKRRKDEEETAHVFEEFLETFQKPANNTLSKVWVKSEICSGGTSKDVDKSIYKPTSRFVSQKSSIEAAQECARVLKMDSKNSGAKPKSNLESFKEELELIHRDRVLRQREENYDNAMLTNYQADSRTIFDAPDPYSTNLYVNNMSMKITESHLMELFGKYGPLASVKIMWPRTDEEKSRNRNCGFVAFMSRKDAHRALVALSGKLIFDCELKVNWGKSVALPIQPIYIPNVLLDFYKPPPKSGLIFNAQPPKDIPISQTERFIENSIVKVVIPTDRNVLMIIHRMIEFVIHEGVLFEAFMMNREMNNPNYRFLFDNRCAEHIYYRWKLFSILQGDSVKQWRTKEFRMFEGGPVWRPPVYINFTEGMPAELVKPKPSIEELRMSLSNNQRDHLETLIHRMQPRRIDICQAMIFCMEHTEACEEIAECLAQSLDNPRSLKKVVARLYLISDVLYNSRDMKFRNAFQNHLEAIMRNMNIYYDALENEDKRLFYVKVTRMFNSWQQHRIYPQQYLDSLYELFILGKNRTPGDETDRAEFIRYKSLRVDDIVPEAPEPPAISQQAHADAKLSGFAPSRWEIVDPDIIESQAVTTEKWNEVVRPNHQDGCSETSKGHISEEKRKKLREIEVQVMKYQDDIESGKVKLKLKTVEEQVNMQREKMIRQMEQEVRDGKKRKSDEENCHKKKKRHHSKSRKH